MAIKYGFFNSVDGDRKYNAEDVGRYLYGIVSDGVFMDDTGRMQVLSTGGMSVAVQTGRAMLAYHYIENDSAYTLTLDLGTTLPRIDLIILKLSHNSREITIEVKKGTPAASPTLPILAKESTVQEFALASITVAANAAEITQANIQDLRPNSAYCGWVTGLIQQLDTATLFAQWEALYAEQYVTFADDFRSWFDVLTSALVVDTYIHEHKRTHTTIANDTDINIDIPEYNPNKDILIASINGVLFTETEDYTITGTGDTALFHLVRPVSAGNTIEFRVLKSKIGSSGTSSDGNTNSGTAVYDETTGNLTI